jgi:mono/diheme cytochrome c family protein
MQRFPALILLVIGMFVTAACQPTVGVPPTLRPLPETALETVPIVADEQGRPLVPSAEEGRRVFERNCATCHGVEGRGDGPLANFLKAPHKNPFTDTMRLLGLNVKVEELPSRPADFHNQVQMRLNSPTSMHETVTLGRPHTAMPAFGPKPAYGANDGIPGPRYLSDADRWHVIFYEWSFATSPATIERGRQIFQEREFPVPVPGVGTVRTACAGCHGPAGDGRGALGFFRQRRPWGWALQEGPGVFIDRNFMVKRKPTELFDWIYDGIGLMPPYKQFLTTDEIWALVDYIWTFIYQYSPPRGQQP